MVAAASLAGQRFEKLLVIERAGTRNGHSLWRCICDCGKEVLIKNDGLKRGTKSCGCLNAESLRNRTINLVGDRYGRLVVTKMLGREGDSTLVECLCDCGNTCVATSHILRSGSKKQSCGCLFTEAITKHGMSGTPEYKAWEAMIQRCHNCSHRQFGDYGGRGIFVCDEWRGSGGFERFFADMGNRPTSRHSIDRYPDNDSGYRKDNCRWATKSQQRKNQRSIPKKNVLSATHNGVTKNLTEWSSVIAISRKHIHTLVVNKGESIASIIERFGMR